VLGASQRDLAPGKPYRTVGTAAWRGTSPCRRRLGDRPPRFDGRVMRAILALTRYKRTRRKPRKASKLEHLSWSVLVAVGASLAIEKA
jgi:hypothetical protein